MRKNNNNHNINADRSFTYQMFVHLEELRRAKSARVLRLSYSKMELTSKLIDEKLPKLDEFGSEDLRAINREIDFKEELRTRIREMHERSARHHQRVRRI